MCYIEEIFSAARQEVAQAIVVEAGSPPRWVSIKEPFKLQDKVESEVLTAFLFRLMPSCSQARLAMGHPVEFQALVNGDQWSLLAESTEIGFFVHATPITSIEESLTHLAGKDERDKTVEVGFENEAPVSTKGTSQTSEEHFDELPDTQTSKYKLGPPPLSAASLEGKQAWSDDDFDQILFRKERPNEGGPDLSSFTYDFGQDINKAPALHGETDGFGPGIPGYVEDMPFGVATGPSSLVDSDVSYQGRGFDRAGTLLLVRSRAVMEATLKHLQEPMIRVKDDSSLFDTYPCIDALCEGRCVCVEVEDPSVWFAWIMRRLEQRCTVVVLCRATDELGALRVLCGLNPGPSCSRWLAEHRRVFLPDLDTVTSLFVAAFSMATDAAS